MIYQMIKKQALIFLRNPVELLLLLGLPVILITILGNGLGGLMDGGELDLSFKLAVIEEEDETAQVERFIADLERSDFPEEIIQELSAQASSIAPVETLVDIFQSEELEDIILLDRGNANTDWESDDYAAIVIFPENFTFHLLENLFLDKERQPEVVIQHQEGATIAGNIVEQIITTYQEEYTRFSFLGQRGIDPEAYYALSQEVEGQVTSINPHHPVTAMTYYAIGMVAMNVLFMASAIAEYAYREKQLHVFNRMLLANVSEWAYFISTLLTGMLFALLQILIVFGFSYVFFGVTWPDISAFIITSLFFALAVGGLAVLLTAISFRANSTQIISFFSGIIVTLFAFIGGSFFPIGDHSSLMQSLGDLTPNGAAMSAYLSIIRGESLVESISHFLFLGAFAFGAIIIGILSFPRRGVSS